MEFQGSVNARLDFRNALAVRDFVAGRDGFHVGCATCPLTPDKIGSAEPLTLPKQNWRVLLFLRLSFSNCLRFGIGHRLFCGVR
jgi:hypothetical protein